MISICLPTRGRPERFAEMYRSVLRTASRKVEVIAVLDADDESAPRYPEGPLYVVNRERRNQSDLWNVAWSHASGRIAHMGADDLIYRTRGWDVAVERTFSRWRDRIGMVYVNDLNPVSPRPFHGMKASESIVTNGKPRYVFAANPFCSWEWIDAAGWFTPPYYRSWESDTWIYLVADAISRAQYLHDVVIEHMHPMAGKAEMDETYARGVAGNPRMKVQMAAITRSTIRQRNEQVARLTEAIQERRR